VMWQVVHRGYTRRYSYSTVTTVPLSVQYGIRRAIMNEEQVESTKE
jgi:hypothetical protein